MARTTTSPVRDLMRRIEELRIEQMKHPERSAAIREERNELREELRFELHREHLADMQMAQGMGECHFGSLDPMPHRQNYRPAPVTVRSWAMPALCAVLLVVCGVAGLMAYFDVLADAAPLVAKVGK